MAGAPVRLGDVDLEAFEIPERLAFGGTQRLAVHELPGGARIVQALGGSPAPREWDGIFMGPQALARARSVDAIRSGGRPVTLAWHDFSVLVVVAEFVADFEKFFHIPYRIRCEVVRDESDEFTGPPVVTRAAAIAADVRRVQSTARVINDPVLVARGNELEAGIRSINDFTRATRQQVQQVLGPIAAMRAQAQRLIGGYTSAIRGVTTLGGLLPANRLTRQVSAMGSQVQATTRLPQLYALDHVLTRVQANTQAGANQSRAVTVGNGNLFDVAAREYGDAAQWDRIGRASGTLDPRLPDIRTLDVPR